MKAEYVKNTNDDLMAANAARVSFDKHHENFIFRRDLPEGVTRGSDEGLIYYLASHVHWTPFSHMRRTFQVDTRYFEILNLYNLHEEHLAGLVFDRERAKARHSVYGWINILRHHQNLINATYDEENYGLFDVDIGILITDALSTHYPETMKAHGLYNVIEDFDFREDLAAEIGFLTDEDIIEDNPYFIDITMRETVPIFVARQRFKHTVGFTYNEVSRRYVDDVPEFYVPGVWRSKPEGSIKQGSGSETIDELVWEYDVFTDPTNGQEYPQEQKENIHTAYKQYIDFTKWLYSTMINNEVAPEMARMVLPQSMYTSYYVTGNLVAWIRAFKERSADGAQEEIKQLSNDWSNVIQEHAPHHWKTCVMSR